jgi:hypothetical protein
MGADQNMSSFHQGTTENFLPIYSLKVTKFFFIAWQSRLNFLLTQIPGHFLPSPGLLDKCMLGDFITYVPHLNSCTRWHKATSITQYFNEDPEIKSEEMDEETVNLPAGTRLSQVLHRNHANFLRSKATACRL